MKILSFTITLLFLSLVAFTEASTFAHKISGHVAAHNKAFHDALTKQLKAAKAKANQLLAVTTSTTASSASTAGVLPLASSSSPVSFASAATSTFQIYLNTTLPSPAPSAACASALTATVQCNSTVPLMSISPFVLNNDLKTVCTAACTSSLNAYRAKVVSSCPASFVSGNITYPSTYAVDSIIGPYNIQCLQDPSNSQFCSPQVTSFNTSGGLLALPTSELCTFCTMETLNVTLSSPATYSIPLAGLLSSAIGTCGANFTKYNVTSPPKAQVTAGAGAQFGAPPSTSSTTDCLLVGRNITTIAATTCAAVSSQFSVSDNDVLANNPFITSNCSINANAKLCLPQACTTYTIAVNDTCDSVAALAGGRTGTNITSVQLQSFNPELGVFCQLMSLKVGKKICLTPNGGFPKVGATSNANPSATPTAKASVPVPTPSGTTSNCGQFYKVQLGDVCNTVVLNNSISLSDFFVLNPEVNENCTNLWLGYNYCVAPFPPLTSVSVAPVITTNYSTATFLTIPFPTGYTPTLATITLTAAGIPAPTNVASGTRTVACGYYYNISTGDTLASIATTVNRNSSDLLTWNPELANGVPAVGSAICVSFPTGNYTLLTADVPTNVAANVSTANCAQYYTIQSGDSCGPVATKFGITSAEFFSLNPGLSTACTNLALGEAYCVFPTTPIGGGGSGTSIPSNVAAGTITTGCTQYYTVVSGDTCTSIDTKFNLTLTQFISFNPEINSGCTNIALGSAYCVKSSNTTTGGGTTVPSNVAAGTITSGCTQYYTVVSGDTCTSIDTKFNLSLPQFISFNPEINSGCTNIALGSAYCVKSSNSTGTTIPSNVAAGTITSGCTQYYTVVSGDTCTAIDTKFNITLTQFISFNPEINSGCTNIALGSAYCVHSSNTTTTPPTGPPSNLATGSFSNCTTYHTVVSGDTCPGMEQTFALAAPDFFRWNPEVDDPACTKILVGSAYCVAGGGGACKKLYKVVSGDTCSKIVSSQGVTQATINSLNPKVVDTACDNLIVGENLCLA